MKKVYIIPILTILIISMLFSSTYALNISGQTVNEIPPFTVNGQNIFCIEKGGAIGSGNIAIGTTSSTYQESINNAPTYKEVGTYDLPIEIAYALTAKEATLEEKQYAIWYSAMNEGRKLEGDPGDTDLADLPEYQKILELEKQIQTIEDGMKTNVVEKNDITKAVNEIKMQNTNIEAVLQKMKVQSGSWSKEPDVSFIQKMYEDNQDKITDLEANGGDATEIERLKTINEKIKVVIDEKSYSSYISFLEQCIVDNNTAISELENSVSGENTEITGQDATIQEIRKQIEEEKKALSEAYTKLYQVASNLLREGKEYKDFYERIQAEGGFNPTSSKDTTKLVKKTNNTYIAGPFELHYIEGYNETERFSYIENMYLEDQDGEKIYDIEIVDCEEFDRDKKYPASDAKFYIKFTAREKDILEDEDVSSSTWREGKYKYTETTTVKTYGVKLIVNFKYLQTCSGKYTRYEGTGDKITWGKETETIDGKTVTYWVAEDAGDYKAQSLIGVSTNTAEVNLEIPEGEISTNNVGYDYTDPTRAWGEYSLEVEANGRDEEEDLEKEPIRTSTPGNRRTPTPTVTTPPPTSSTSTPTETTPPPTGSTSTPTETTPPPTITPTPTPTTTPEPLELTMEVAGYVFEDIEANKENIANGLLDYNSNDRLLEGIEVAIYEENGDLVRLVQEYEENPEISKEDAEIRTNPTLTDENGYYTFKGLDPDKKYYVEFRYNGLTYEATTYKASVGQVGGTVYTGEAWKINSKAVENVADRTKLNGIYGEISAYPNSYKKAYDIGLGVGEYNKVYMQTDLVNNAIYSWNQESVNIYTLITRHIQNYIEKNRKYPDILEIYKNIYQDQIGYDTEIANKLQFIEDSKISAYTSADGETKDLYPIYEEFAIEEEKVKIDATYEPIYVGQKYINFGIKSREEFDLSIAKDVYNAEVQINGKVQRYNYNNVEIDYTDESWSAYVKGSDVGFDRNIYAADYLAKDIGVDNLQVYVTYRIALRNQTSLVDAGVTKLVDYYDSEYTYVGNTSENGYTGVNGGKAYVGNSKGELIANVIWENGEKNGNYNTGYITFENSELNLKNGEDKFIYITFKVNKNDAGLLYSDGEITAEGTVQKQAVDAKQNIVEIIGYKTYYASSKTFSNGKTTQAGSIAGVIDRDSIAGNLNPMNSEDINKEDDSDKASGFNLLVDWSNFRGLSGNVWEELPTENSLNEGTRLGNGEKDAGEVNIKNVTVKVLIDGTDTLAKGYVKGEDGTYSWKDLITVTDDNGNYSFTGYVPGDYKVRFTYGNVSEDGSGILTDEMKKYNGQDYKSTIYNNDSMISTQGSYWYAVNSDKLKSDVKDDWARREAVNSYSIELDNEKSNILKEASSNEILKSEKTWMTSETDKLVFEIEYARGATESVVNSNDNHIYKVENIDLGLIERPRSQVLIEKDVAAIKVVLGDGKSVLFDAQINENGEIVDRNSNIGIIKRVSKLDNNQTDIKVPKFGVGKNGQITMNIDEELMQGAEIHITYKVSAKNIGEIDYTTQEFYYNGTKGTDEQIAKTTAKAVVDYVSNNLAITKTSSDWAVADKEVLKGKDGNPAKVVFASDVAGLSDAEYTSGIIDSYNNILQTNALGVSLKPGEEKALDLLLTTTISPENDEDDLRYDNILELIESENDVGRRFELSVLGNQNPNKEVEELDSGKAETVLIIPPFGMNDNLSLTISISIILIAAFGIGVYYIKKRVLK